MSVVSEPACYLLFRKGDKLLFVFREHTGYMDGNYSLPAGHVEEAETYMAGAMREAQEEVGLTVRQTDLRHVFTMHRWSEGQNPPARTDVFFETTEWGGEPLNNEPEKHSKIEWLSVGDLPENIMDYQRYALLQIVAGESYGEFGWSKVEKTEQKW